MRLRKAYATGRRALQDRPRLSEPDTLHTYRCDNCSGVLVVTHKSDRIERCRGCGSWMRFLYSAPIETDEHRAIAAKGLAWNPNRVAPQTCDLCGRNIFDLFGDTFIAGVGQFCKDKPTLKRFCTTEGIQKHEQAMMAKEQA